jgi:hypothetical protein
VFVASRSTRRAAISARHTWLMTVSALSRKYNIFNCYVVFSRHNHRRARPLDPATSRVPSSINGPRLAVFEKVDYVSAIQQEFS